MALLLAALWPVEKFNDIALAVGRVHAAHTGDGTPLMFQSGAYKEFASQP